MLTRTRRRSARITLVLLGVAALAACNDDARQRDLYASKQDCVKDWGDETKCEVAPASSTGGRTGTHYWGPSYSRGTYRASSGTSVGSVSAPRSGSHAVGTSSVSRGGFGSSASSHSSGGG